MIGKKIEAELNKQVNEELFSAYLYLSMSADFAAKNMKGFAHWMKVQAGEEMEHAMKLYNHIIDRGGQVQLLAIKQPQASWKTPLDAFQAAYAHEQHITGRINYLIDVAMKEKDNASGIMLQWFVTEQVEEEANASENVEKLKMAGNNTGALMMLDSVLAKRKGD
jgi:ferritin